MLALRSAPPVFSAAEAERIARDEYGLGGGCRRLPGERDCNFHLRTAEGRDHVLKVVDAAADPAATDCQVRVLRHLGYVDPALPVPRLRPTQAGGDLGLVVRDGVPFSVCLLDYLPGRMLADAAPDEGLLRSVGASLARVDRALQGFFHPALSRRIVWDVRCAPDLLEFAGHLESVEVRGAVQRAVADLTRCLPRLAALRAQAIHGDLHAQNLLVAPGSPTVSGILDFGDIIHAPIVMEAAVAMSEILTEGLAAPPQTAALLAGYADLQPLEAAEVDVLYDLIRARHAVTLLVHAWRRRHDPAGAGLLAQAAQRAGPSLLILERLGREALTAHWQRAAGIADDDHPVDRERRSRLLGGGAELFYAEPLHLVRGAGVWMFDARGEAYLDAYNNVPHVGHCHPTVVRAVQRQTARLATHTRYLHGAILEYAQALTARCPPHLDACLFVNSGSEANDVAWRLAKLASGHAGALILAHAYHGITDAVAALTPAGATRGHDPWVAVLALPPVPDGPAGALSDAQIAATAADADRALRELAGRGFGPAALFIDSALTSSGIHDPSPVWLATIVARVRAAGGLIVADEVQVGLGRCGSHFWGFQRRGVTPDIVTLGKPMANGYPMGGVIANRALIENFQAACGFFSTFGGNPVAARAGLAVLEVLDREGLMANAERIGGYLQERIDGMGDRCGLGPVRGSGLLLGVEVRGEDPPHARRRTRTIVDALAARHRVLIGAEGPHANVLKLRPPMPFAAEHADLLVAGLAAAAGR